MSGLSGSQSNVDELLEIGNRCSQVRKEKDLLKERITISELWLNPERSEDKKRIVMLEHHQLSKQMQHCVDKIKLVDEIFAETAEENARKAFMSCFASLQRQRAMLM